jgi:hypothetical protein
MEEACDICGELESACKGKLIKYTCKACNEFYHLCKKCYSITFRHQLCIECFSEGK